MDTEMDSDGGADSIESDDETDTSMVVELEEDPDLDPDSFDSIQKNLHTVLNKNQIR